MSKANQLKQIVAVMSTVAFCILLSSNSLMGQDCPAIACNDEIQISLDQDCDFLLNVDLFIEGDSLTQKNDPTANFTLSISSLEISKLPLTSLGSSAEGWNSEKLFGSHLYKIENDCRNSCWGTVNIESKLPPRITNDPDEIWTFNCSEIHDVLNSDDYTANWGLNPEISNACERFNYNMYFKDAFSQLPDCANKNQSTFTSMLTGTITDDLNDDLLLMEDQHIGPGGVPLNMFGASTSTEWRADLHVAPDISDCNLMVDVNSELKYLVSRIDGTYDWEFAELEVYVYTISGNNIVATSQLNSFPASVPANAQLLVKASHPNAEGTYKLTFTGDCHAGLENNVCVRKWYVSSMDHGNKTEQLVFKQKFHFNSLDLATVWCPESNFVVACDVSNHPDSLYKYFSSSQSDSAGIVNAYPHILTNKRKKGIVKVDSLIHEEIPIDTIIDKLYIGGEWVLVPVVTKEIKETIVKVDREVDVPIIIALPPGSHQCNIVVAHDDVEVPICGYGSKGSHKVVRTWSVIDWCSEETKTCTQVFEVRDTEPPHVELTKDKMKVSVDPWQCAASVFMPPIHVSDNCNADIDLAHDKSMEVHMEIEDVETEERYPVDRIWVGDMDVPSQIQTDYNGYPMGFMNGVHTGTYWVHYTVYDECGNKSLSKKTLLEIVDDVPPVAVCPEELAVTLVSDGPDYGGAIAKVPAASFNNGSHDAGCNEVYIKVIRMDELEAASSSDYGYPVACDGPDAIVPGETDKYGVAKDSTWLVYFDDHVKFCCGDERVLVVMRVFDQNPGDGPISPSDFTGSYNDCMIWVNVKQQAPYLTQCAPERYIDCEDDTHDMDKMGMPSLGSSCHEHGMMYHDTDYGDPTCGDGRIERAWYYDMNENGDIDEDDAHLCDQYIYLTAHSFNPTSIKWPAHYTGDWVSGVHIEGDAYGFCYEKPFEIQLASPLNCADDIVLCTPEWQDITCGLIGYNVDVDTLKVPNSGGCSKIINRWTIIDWCNYDPNEYHEGSNHYNERFVAVKDDCDNEGCIATSEYGTYFRYARTKNYAGRDSAAIAWDGYYTWEQVVKIVDDQVPVIDAAVSIDAQLIGSACDGSITITKHAEDTGCISQLSWDVSLVDSEGNIIANHSAQGTDLSWEVPEISAGVFTVKYAVSDGCQNIAYEEDTYSVKDDREPTPYCISGVSTAVMQGQGEVTIWASDFDLGAYDNCDERRYLRFTFSDTHPDEDENYIVDRRSSSLNYSCADLDENGVTVLELRVYVWDTNDNKDYCTVALRVDDNESICDNLENEGESDGEDNEGEDNQGGNNNETENNEDSGGDGNNQEDGDNGSQNGNPPTGGQTARISGVITTPQGGMIDYVDISINSTLDNYPKTFMSQSGLFSFEDNPVDYNYVLAAKRDDDYLNGVSTLDLVLMQQHILGLKTFENGYDIIASDANNDHKVSALDILLFRQLILGLIDDLPENDSWRFVDANDFIDVTNPWPFTEQILVNSLQSNALDINFVGLKVGDVSGNAKANNLESTETRFRSTSQLQVNDVFLNQNERYSIELMSLSDEDMYGIQFGLESDKLEFLHVKSGVFNISTDNYNINNQRIAISAHQHKPVSKGDHVLTIEVAAKSSGFLSDMLKLGDILTPEIYVSDAFEVEDLELVYDQLTHKDFELLQNQPNPFTESTYIKFSMPSAMSATFRVVDATGKEMFTTTRKFKKGVNELKIHKNELNTVGILYYQLYTKEFTSTKKMILMN